MTLLYATVAFCVLGMVVSQRTKQPVNNQICADVIPMADFEQHKIEGLWHLSGISTNAPNLLIICPRVEFEYANNKTSVIGRAHHIQKGPVTVHLDVRAVDPTNPAKLTASSSEEEEEKFLDFVILGTDYENYVAVHACIPLGHNWDYVMIFTKDSPRRSARRQSFTKGLHFIRQFTNFDNVKFKRTRCSIYQPEVSN